MFSAFIAIIRRDLLVAIRRGSEIAQPLAFFVLLAVLFTLGLNPEPALLREIAPAVIWTGALLASMLALDGLFRSDFEDGTLAQLLLLPQPLTVIVVAKVVAHWIATGLPLILIAPLLALMLNLDIQALGVLMLGLLLGTPVLSLIGAIGAALTVGLKRGGALLPIIVLPLYVPLLIFGANSAGAAQEGLAVSGQMYLLAAFLSLTVTLAPFAIATALRITME